MLQPISLISDFLNGLPAITQEQVYDTSITIKPRSEGSRKKKTYIFDFHCFDFFFVLCLGAKEVDEDAAAVLAKSTGIVKAGWEKKVVLFVVVCSCSESQAPVVAPTENWGELDFPPGYAFCVPDSDDNIDVDETDHKLILFATEEKLVERLTYEKYSGNGVMVFCLGFLSSSLIYYYYFFFSQTRPL